VFLWVWASRFFLRFHLGRRIRKRRRSGEDSSKVSNAVRCVCTGGLFVEATLCVFVGVGVCVCVWPGEGRLGAERRAWGEECVR